MNYATVADFIAAFGLDEAIALSNLDDPTAEITDEAIITSALETATADLDSYLRSAGYSLPLPEIPRVLVGKCCDIARYKLDRNRAREEVRQRYLDAVFWCKDLAKGIASLGITSTGVADDQVGMVGFYQRDRTFTLDSLSDY